MNAPPAAGEPGPPDEPSRVELERLEKIFAAGRSKFVARRFLLSLIPSILFVSLIVFGPRGRSSSPLYFILASQVFALGIGAGVVWFSVWPQFQKRAADIRAGASYAAPAELKDAQIFLFISLGLMVLWIAGYLFLRDMKDAEAASIFIFVAAVVTILWTFIKALKGYLRCPPTHLRHGELRSAWIVAITALFIFISAAIALTKLTTLMDTLLRTAPRPKAAISTH